MRTANQRGIRLASIAAASVAVIASAGCSAPAAEEESGPVTLNWWSWNPDQNTAVQYIDAFEADHPDITIKHRFIQYSDYVNTTQLALTSGSGPDVFGLQVGALTEQFAPLTADLAPALEEALGGDWADQLTATDQLAVDGKQVALPWMITGGGLVWANQTLVDSLGLTVPETTDELDAFCADVTAAGKTCIVQGAKDSWQNIDVFQTIANQIAPGKFYDAIAGDASFDDADFVQAFDVWKSLFDDGVFQEGALAATAYPDANDAFHKGDAALIVFGSWQNSDTTQASLDQASRRMATRHWPRRSSYRTSPPRSSTAGRPARCSAVPMWASPSLRPASTRRPQPPSSPGSPQVTKARRSWPRTSCSHRSSRFRWTSAASSPTSSGRSSKPRVPRSAT